MNTKKPKILIIDDNRDESEPLVAELKHNYDYDDVKVEQDPAKALEYISKHFSSKMIVILDIKFPPSAPNGHKVLDEIRQFSSLIPVIIWSAVDETREEFADFINNHAFAFISRPRNYGQVIEKLQEAEAWLEFQVAAALEDWISLHPEEKKKKPYIIAKDGKSYTLNDILREIRNRTPQGIDFEKKMIMLVIDMLARSKIHFQKESE
jgi:DNA-binding NtrC family response regulator